jgi:ParB-like chromosome segregation protein Spo0J
VIERTELPVDALVTDEMQSRERAWVGDDEDRQLAASIAEEGLLNDIIVRPHGGDPTDGDASYSVVAGSRRYHAAMEAGLETVPAKIVHADDLEAAWTSLRENVDRRDLSEQEIAQQLSVLYRLVRPRSEPSECPACETSVDGERGLLAHVQDTDCELPTTPEDSRFLTERQAVDYLARNFLGRDDDGGRSLIRGHLRTADLPPELQALFKKPEKRTRQENAAIENHGVSATTTLGSGEGKSGTSREVIALHEAVDEQFDRDAIDPVDAVLETVGELPHDQMSEQELRRTLRDVRHDLTERVEAADNIDAQRDAFSQTLRERAEELVETYDEVGPSRPFKKVDVMGPDTQQHSRWHVQAMKARGASGHGELVRELYQERLEQLAEEEGWD